ncbi:NTP transferase domain-containing protein [Streptomyces sp. NPDC055051]
MTTAYDAVVLAGGAARRLGGVDKPGVRVGGRALLDRVLAACAGARLTVVVGDPRPTVRTVRWTREQPAGTGPLAALAAGAAALATTAPGAEGDTATDAADPARPATPAGPSTPSVPATPAASPAPATPAGPSSPPASPAPEVVLVLSADLPFLGEATVHRLLAALDAEPDAEAVFLTDAEGRDQPLVAVHRAAPLRRALDELRRTHHGLDGLPLRYLTAGLRTVRVPAGPEEASASFDCDTWEDIATARARIRDHGAVLDEWITAVKTELGLDLDVDTGVLLDLARDAAHGVARP